MTGIMTLSSKLPAAPAGDGRVVPDHLRAHHQRGLGQHRVHLAGHDARARLQVGQVDLGEAGARAGRIQRRSLQILVRPTANVRSAPESSTSESRVPCASKWSRASVNGCPVSREPLDHRARRTRAAC